MEWWNGAFSSGSSRVDDRRISLPLFPAGAKYHFFLFSQEFIQSNFFHSLHVLNGDAVMLPAIILEFPCRCTRKLIAFKAISHALLPRTRDKRAVWTPMLFGCPTAALALPLLCKNRTRGAIKATNGNIPCLWFQITALQSK